MPTGGAPACTEASYQCLDNVTTPDFQRACVLAMTACDEWLNRLRSLGSGLSGIMTFPDKRTTVIAPGGDQEPYVRSR